MRDPVCWYPIPETLPKFYFGFGPHICTVSFLISILGTLHISSDLSLWASASKFEEK